LGYAESMTWGDRNTRRFQYFINHPPEGRFSYLLGEINRIANPSNQPNLGPWPL
jgi:hypothetical protein